MSCLLYGYYFHIYPYICFGHRIFFILLSSISFIWYPFIYQVKRILTNGTIFQVCDPALGSMVPAETLRQLVLLAQKCTALQGRLRPSMKEVVTLLKDIKSHYKRLMSSGDVEDSFESSFGVTGLQSSTTGNGDVESSSGFKAPISFAPKLR